MNVEEKKTRPTNGDRNDRERSGLSRQVSGGGMRSNGDRSGPMNRAPNSGGILRSSGGQQTGTNAPRSGGNGQNSRPFNRSDRQPSGPRGNNGTPNTASSGGNSGGFQRR